MAIESDRQIDELVDVAMRADGGCIYCVGPILRTYRRVFPEVDWAAAVRRSTQRFQKSYTADEYIEAMDGEPE